MDTPFPAPLAAALVRAQARAKAVPKDAENAQQKYRYASSESIIDEGRLTLSSEKLALLQLGSEITVKKGSESTDGESGEVKTSYHVIVKSSYVLALESGESVRFDREWPAIDHRGRPLDKAVGGALTTCLSYAIRDLLLLPRDDELAAMDRRDDRDHEPGRAAPTQAQRQASPPPESQRQPAPAPQKSAVEQLVDAINGVGQARGNFESCEREINGLDAPAEAKESLRYLVQAWCAPDAAAFAKIGASIRKNLSKPFADATLERIRLAYDTNIASRRAA